MASVSNDGYIINKVDRPIGELRRGSYTYFANGDIIIAKITPCMENGKCAIASDLTNAIGFGSSEFHTFRCKDGILTKYLFTLLNQNIIRKAAENAMTGTSGHRRVPAKFYEEMMIPVPPIPVQEKIISACEKVDKEYNSTRMSIEEYRNKIEMLFDELEVIAKNSGGVQTNPVRSNEFCCFDRKACV